MPKIIETQRAQTIQKTKPRDAAQFRSPSPARVKESLITLKESNSRLQNSSLDRAISHLEQSQSQLLHKASPTKLHPIGATRQPSMQRDVSKGNMFELLGAESPLMAPSPGKRNSRVYNTINTEKRSSTTQRYPTPINA
jgi:hypothetical protein